MNRPSTDRDVSMPQVVRVVVSRWLPIARPYYLGAGPAHDLAHVLRVVDLVANLAGTEREAPRLPLLAAIFHDAGRSTSADDHEKTSADLAIRLLAPSEPSDDVEAVAEMIRRHRFSKSHGPPASRSEAIFRDADRLDAIGFSGIARVFLYLGEHGRDASVDVRGGADVDALEEHWRSKLSKLPAGMHTATGRRWANEREQAVANFVRNMQLEVRGSEVAGAARRRRPK